MQVLSISSLKGGVGKTSVILGLASAALERGLSTLVIDLDPHSDATTGLAVHGEGKDGIGQMLKDPRNAELLDNIAPSQWTENVDYPDRKPVLDVVMGSSYSTVFDSPGLGPKDLRRLDQILDDLETEAPDRYDLVLIDCPPSINGLTRIAWNASDSVLLVTEPSLFSVAGTERTLRAIDAFRQEFAPDLTVTGVVTNRVREGVKEHEYRMSELTNMFGSLVLDPPLADQPNWQQIQGAAQPIHHWPGKSAQKASERYDLLLESVLAKLKMI